MMLITNKSYSDLKDSLMKSVSIVLVYVAVQLVFSIFVVVTHY